MGFARRCQVFSPLGPLGFGSINFLRTSELRARRREIICDLLAPAPNMWRAISEVERIGDNPDLSFRAARIDCSGCLRRRDIVF
jgi:hypothetical protein